MRRKKRVINGQKIFIFVSFIFLLTCCFFYGGRAVYFYLNSKKVNKSSDVVFANMLLTSNKSLQKVDDDFYFYQDVDNNYVSYSGLIFRIIKVYQDNKVALVTDEPITSLAFGTDVSFKNSPILNWLNNNSNRKGILENKLTNINKYLDKTITCIDDVDDIKNITCKDTSTDTISLLTVSDYIHTGGTKSFINNGFTTYLANNGKDKKVWYVNSDGKLSTNDGDDLYGIKVVITLKSDISISKGSGTKNDPYIISDDKNYFASYVKLGDDIWRVYDEESKLLKLSLDDYLKVDDKELEYIYSNNNSFHNDTVSGSLAYYLNKTYLNSLDYKDLVVVNNYDNGYYNDDNNYDFTTSLDKKADTKVSNLSVGNVILNHSLDNYFLATGVRDKGNYVYLAKKDGSIDTIKVSNKAKVVPCISIDKSKLVNGSGTKDDPYRTE